MLTRRAIGHRTLRPASGGHRPVTCCFENLSAHEWSPDASGATLRASGDPTKGAYNSCPGCCLGSCLFNHATSPEPPRALAHRRRCDSPFLWRTPCPSRQICLGTPPLPSLASGSDSRAVGRVWVSSLNPALKVFDLLCLWIQMRFFTVIHFV